MSYADILIHGGRVFRGLREGFAEAVAIHGTGNGEEGPVLKLVRNESASLIAESFGEGFIQRKVAVEEEKAPPTVTELRRRALVDGELLDKPQKSGLWARIFGRR